MASSVLRGVQHGLGISVWHPDYFEFNRGGFEQIGKKIGEKLLFRENRIEGRRKTRSALSEMRPENRWLACKFLTEREKPPEPTAQAHS